MSVLSSDGSSVYKPSLSPFTAPRTHLNYIHSDVVEDGGHFRYPMMFIPLQAAFENTDTVVKDVAAAIWEASGRPGRPYIFRHANDTSDSPMVLLDPTTPSAFLRITDITGHRPVLYILLPDVDNFLTDLERAYYTAGSEIRRKGMRDALSLNSLNISKSMTPYFDLLDADNGSYVRTPSVLETPGEDFNLFNHPLLYTYR